VHCKREEIEGEWVFRINNDLFNPSLADYRSTCGHGFPDKIEKLEADINFAFDDFRDLRIFLGKDYKIYDPVSNEVKGKWTPVYDEGFIVNYDNFVFTAFMKYFLNPNLKNIKIKKNAKAKNVDYMSNCQKTMIGWFIKDEKENEKNWSCFFGFKKSIENEFDYLSQSTNKGFFNSNIINHNLFKKVLKPNKNFSAFRYFYYNKKTKRFDKDNDDEENFDTLHNNNKANSFLSNNSNKGFVDLNFDLLDSLENDSFLEMKTQTESSDKMKIKLNHLKYEEQFELINEINSNNLSWRAQMHDDFKGLSFLDLKAKLGLRDSKKERSFFNKKQISSNMLYNINSSEARFKEENESKSLILKIFKTIKIYKIDKSFKIFYNKIF
jgi:hypothetical protein